MSFKFSKLLQKFGSKAIKKKKLVVAARRKVKVKISPGGGGGNRIGVKKLTKGKESKISPSPSACYERKKIKKKKLIACVQTCLLLIRNQ